MMAGWVLGVKESHIVQTPVPSAKRGPVVLQPKRVCVDLPSGSIAEVLAKVSVLSLPWHTGAGPCGTVARYGSGRSYAMLWTRRHLVAPIRAYYAAYVPPMRFGAKPGPRGRRVA